MPRCRARGRHVMRLRPRRTTPVTRMICVLPRRTFSRADPGLVLMKSTCAGRPARTRSRFRTSVPTRRVVARRRVSGVGDRALEAVGRAALRRAVDAGEVDPFGAAGDRARPDGRADGPPQRADEGDRVRRARGVRDRRRDREAAERDEEAVVAGAAVERGRARRPVPARNSVSSPSPPSTAVGRVGRPDLERVDPRSSRSPSARSPPAIRVAATTIAAAVVACAFTVTLRLFAT